jgi:hypothetical protein
MRPPPARVGGGGEEGWHSMSAGVEAEGGEGLPKPKIPLRVTLCTCYA